MKNINRLLLSLLTRRMPGRRYERTDLRDLYYCYRLLLQREPDEASWQHWSGLIQNNQADLQTLVEGFLATEEFFKLQEAVRKAIVVDLDDFCLYVRQNDFFIGAAIARDKVYEPQVTAKIRQLLKPGDTFVDIGANIGYFTCMAAAIVGSNGHVYSFEPKPDNIELIERSVDANGFTNVHLFPFAVAEKAQTFKLDAAAASSNARIIDFSPEAVPGLNAPIMVDAVTLDRTLAELASVDIIKLDIEGAEPRAWQGMQQIVQKHRPAILFEYSPDLLRVTSHVEPASLLDSIIDAGYDLFILQNVGPQGHIPQSKDQIVQIQTSSGSTHLDLLALPK